MFDPNHQAVAAVAHRIAPHLAVAQLDDHPQHVVLHLTVGHVGDFFFTFELGDPVGIAGCPVQVDVDPMQVGVLGDDVRQALEQPYGELIVLPAGGYTPRIGERLGCKRSSGIGSVQDTGIHATVLRDRRTLYIWFTRPTT